MSGVTACIPYRNNAPPSPYVPTLIPAAPLCEQHGPYQYGSAYPTVNGVQMDFAIRPMLPPMLGNVTEYGPSAPGVFVSEFGASSLSR